MSSVISQETESSCRQFYSRKEKSLGVLVSNFLRLYNRDDVDLIGLDDAARKLGVERRRIYDVVNILESVGLVTRSGKNQYLWRGFGELPHTLKELREEGLKENIGIAYFRSMSRVSNEDESGEPFSLTPHDQEISSSSKFDNKKEKSLWLLAQNFAKLFLCSNVDLITLDNAAKALLSESSMNMRTKVRRLYDIANVFSSMNLIEKAHVPKSRKPAYRWLGWKDKPDKGPVPLPDLNEPRKRLFGIEITNLSSNQNSKRNKVDFSSDQKSNLKEKENVHRKNKDREEGYNTKKKTEQHSEPGLKSVVYGPFAPIAVSQRYNPGDNIVSRDQDFESFASGYRAQYCNPAMSDLFGHYMEAWTSWYAELGNS